MKLLREESRLYISHGNRKMQKRFMVFNLPHKITCPGRTPLCESICYARKAEAAYPDCYPSRLRNLDASKMPDFVDAVYNHIKRNAARRPFFRIHESGDFYSQEYLDKWIEIARMCQNVKFLAFTKSFALDFSNIPANMQIVWSIMPDTDMTTVPSGPRAYAGACQGMPENVLECPGTCNECGMCWQLGKFGLDVHFEIH